MSGEPDCAAVVEGEPVADVQREMVCVTEMV
jgi:hypothetical protein